ncbi:sensor histidine kinase [Clostridium sp. MSJ-11]|uniref:histidine kinase n=2 Tax=Clostridium mobile TaxID=2841512 RepID=A0ABS6ENI0_9CLOT|nr:sensor histidine kinase [Clostridium mobile]
MLCIILNTLNILDIIKLVDNRKERKVKWEKGVINTIRTTVKDSFIIKSIMFKTTFIIMLTILFGMAIVIGYLSLEDYNSYLLFISLLYALYYLLVIPYYILKKISSLNRIIKGTDEIVSGNLNYTIEEEEKGMLSRLAYNINNMKQGFKNSLESEMKSERLKSELITNVSHDLKTPLTSIINYVDLLKRENLSKDEIEGYIGVLDRKTQRLKILIDDLFEASKIASGSVELNVELVDIVSLANQALAEFDEKIKKSPLTFKINLGNEKIHTYLDGKKTWRVFENLINNALKYSQPNTRVYIDLEDKEHNIIFTIKNVSAYEMDFNVEEIFDRFKRGDKSRNTEGSGLGLAITKSIVEMQGGKLEIEIDGDLFKVMVIFCK